MHTTANTTPSQRIAARARRRLARTLAIAGVVALTLTGVAIGSAVARQASAPVPACATEDSAGPCYWDAASMGNGRGQSFTVDAGQVVRYEK